jgi:hypothetical protein
MDWPTLVITQLKIWIEQEKGIDRHYQDLYLSSGQENSAATQSPIAGQLSDVDVLPDGCSVCLCAKPIPTITLQIADQTNPRKYKRREVRIGMTSRMASVLDSFAQRKGFRPTRLRFMVDGQRVYSNQTPWQLDLQEQDCINCSLETSKAEKLKEAGGPA